MLRVLMNSASLRIWESGYIRKIAGRGAGDMCSGDATGSVHWVVAAHIMVVRRGYVQRMCRRERALRVGCAYHGGLAGDMCSEYAAESVHWGSGAHIMVVERGW